MRWLREQTVQNAMHTGTGNALALCEKGGIVFGVWSWVFGSGACPELDSGCQNKRIN